MVSEQSYHATKHSSEHFLATKMKKNMNKPVYLHLSILEISEIVMHEFCYDYMKPKYGEKAKLCYIDTDSFIDYIKTADIFTQTLQKICN